MAVKNFEALDKDIRDLVKIYYGVNVMVRNARANLYKLEDIDVARSHEIFDASDAQAKYLIKTAKGSKLQKFYKDCYTASKHLYYCQGMFMDARDNYENKVLYGDKFDCVTSPLLLKQVEDLNVTLPEEVKNLVVDTMNDTTEDGRVRRNVELSLAITSNVFVKGL